MLTLHNGFQTGLALSACPGMHFNYHFSSTCSLLKLSLKGQGECHLFSSLGTKTLVVHGQNECDIPTQLPVHEDTQFEALLKVGVGF